MSSFKMIARDVDSSPTEYRTWVVDELPDYDGYYYVGPKGGDNPLLDPVAIPLPSDIGYVDFNLPDPTSWQVLRNQLPPEFQASQLAILDGYIYLFGGMIKSIEHQLVDL